MRVRVRLCFVRGFWLVAARSYFLLCCCMFGNGTSR